MPKPWNIILKAANSCKSGLPLWPSKTRSWVHHGHEVHKNKLAEMVQINGLWINFRGQEAMNRRRRRRWSLTRYWELVMDYTREVAWDVGTDHSKYILDNRMHKIVEEPLWCGFRYLLLTSCSFVIRYIPFVHPGLGTVVLGPDFGDGCSEFVGE